MSVGEKENWKKTKERFEETSAANYSHAKMYTNKIMLNHLAYKVNFSVGCVPKNFDVFVIIFENSINIM